MSYLRSLLLFFFFHIILCIWRLFWHPRFLLFTKVYMPLGSSFIKATIAVLALNVVWVISRFWRRWWLFPLFNSCCSTTCSTDRFHKLFVFTSPVTFLVWLEKKYISKFTFPLSTRNHMHQTLQQPIHCTQNWGRRHSTFLCTCLEPYDKQNNSWIKVNSSVPNNLLSSYDYITWRF